MTNKGVDIFYQAVGEGEPVIVLHGGPGLDHTYLLPPLQSLGERHMLFFYDQRCTGQSAGQATRDDITPTRFINDIAALRQGLGLGKVRLLGHSWGALLALAYASAFPDAVHSLILLHPLPYSRDKFEAATRIALARRTIEEQEALSQMASSEAVLRGKQPAFNAYLKAWIKPYFADPKKWESFALNFGEHTAKNGLLVLNLMLNSLGPYNLIKEPLNIAAPTLIVHGGKDVIPEETTHSLHKHLASSEYVVLPNVGHFSFIEAPEQVLPLLDDFLKR